MLVFRADRNSKIGSGHIMRCLSMADAAVERHIHPCFVTAGAGFRDIIQARGHRCAVMGTDYADMVSELPVFEKILNGEKPEAVIVDSYFVSEAYLNSLRRFAKVVYIDDLAASAWPVDTLVNYNIYAPDMGYEKLYERREKPVLLLGPQYAPLRREFQNLSVCPGGGNVRNVLISTGGADTEHIALRFVQYLKTGHGEEYIFHLLLGALNPDREEIGQLAGSMPNIVVHRNVQNMRELMTSCDIAVSAAGSTLYELCACGLPIITYILADNQIAGAKTFANRGLALLAGDARTEKDFCGALLDRLDDLAGNYKLRLSMAEKAYSVVDGKGAGRIIEEVCR